ncbi:MAG: histidinol dehydrogenase [Gammaproteobacteria bacterium]
MKTINYTKGQLPIFRSREQDNRVDLENTVSKIIDAVRKNGDAALREYTAQFDKVSLDNLKISQLEWQAADDLSETSKQAIIKAYNNIKYFHLKERPINIQSEKQGIILKKEYRPIERVGLYIPGGQAPLVSTLLMLAIPAEIAGCPLKVMVTPPQENGCIPPAILFAAKLCQIELVYKVGGAQAVAALAYGTETVPKVDKIFGPGNKYVMAAKLQVASDPEGAALDMPAGPSEVLVIADDLANPEFVASDLLAQAEHDRDARAILVTTSQRQANAVMLAIEKQIKQLSRSSVIRAALEQSQIIIAPDLEACFDIANEFAPEHLILQIEAPEQYTDAIINAGSVFMGPWSPEAAGDYASGTNHVLPTSGYAKTYSGLSVDRFMKSITFQSLSSEGLLRIGETIETLATLEQLDAHKNSVSIRLKAIQRGVIPCNG